MANGKAMTAVSTATASPRAKSDVPPAAARVQPMTSGSTMAPEAIL